MKTNKYILTLALTVCCALGNLYAATITSSYYSTIDGKSGKDLFDAIHTVSKKGYSSLSYAGLWTAYQTTDVYPTGHANAGKIWDMYGNCVFTYSTNQCGSYSKECDCYNREHSIPKSWFGGTEASNTPGSDLFHVVPTDGKVNGIRSNYAFGEVTSATYSYAGSKLGTKKSITISNSILNASGSSTQTCSTTPVFEPVDEYKGDFARGYLGTMIRWANGDYQTFTTDQGASIFNTAYDAAHYYGLTGYGVALLLKWHRQDPVSQKEIDRNNGIQAKQGNRNPFIDYPCLVEYIWGNKAGETVTLSSLVGTFDGSWTTGDGCPCGDVPAITLPSGDIFVGSTEAGTPVSKTITVQGVNLEANLSLAISGTNSALFSLSATSIQKTYAEAGTTVTITYTPTAAGNHSAVLTISGGGLSSSRTFALTGTCCNPYTVTFSRNGITEQVGACGTFALPTAEEESGACDYEFKGWLASTTSFSEGTTTAPTAWVTSVTSSKTLHAVYGKTTTTGGGSPSTATYTFKSKSWTATEGNWTSGKDGNGYNNSGVQVTTGTNQANATCPSSYSNITSIVVSYCTNGSSGAGSITMGVGSTELTQTVTKTGGTTARDLEFDFSSTKPSGSPKITVNCTTNSIYVCGVTITYGGGGTSTTTYKKLPCTTYTISYADAGGVATGGTYSANVATALAGTTITLDYDEAEGYEFAGWTVTKAGGGSVTVTNGQFTMPEANVTVQASFTALCSKLSAPDATAVAGDGQITLTWEDVTDAVGYTVSIGGGVGYTTECGGEASIADISHSGTTNTCVISGLTNGLAYTTYVVANGISPVCDSDADEDTTIPSAEIPTEVTVTFNANGGEGTMSDQTIPYNTATALDANAFTRTGYTFQGWATEQSGAKVYNDGASVTLTEDITLYAVWQINSHNVTFTQPTSGGTFTVNSSSSSPVSNVNYGSTVTIAITPTNSHFTVGTVTVSGASGSIQVSGSGNTRTFTLPDEDVTVAVTMNEDPKYIVNWYVSGTATPEQNYAGETLVGIDDPSIDCNGKVFQGWTATANYSSDDTAPNDLFTDASTKSMPSNNNTSYYAVFATVEEDEPVLTNNYQKITSTSELTTGNYLIVADHSSTYKAMSTTWKDTYYLSYVTVTPSNDVISTTDGTIIWNIAVSNNQASIYNATSKYLYIEQSGSYYNIKLGDNTTANKFTYGVSSGNWLFTSVTYNTRVLEFYTTRDRWAYHTAADAPVYLYKQQSNSSTTYSDYSTSCSAPVLYEITVNGTEHGSITTSPSETAASGSTVTITLTPDEWYELATLTVKDENESPITVNGGGNTRTFTMPESDVTISATFVEKQKYAINFYVEGTLASSQNVYVGSTPEVPSTPVSCDGSYTFVGWWTSTLDSDNTTAQSWIVDFTATQACDYYAVFSYTEATGGASTVTDLLTRTTTGITGTLYSEWSGKTLTSDAVYAGQSAGDKESIQFRSNNSNSGIVTTASGGKVTKVTVEWNSNTTSDRALSVYGKNTAYSAATDLYDSSKQGTLLGTIVCGTSTELTVTGDYAYIGLRSASGAMYLTSVSVTWSAAGASTTYYTTSTCSEPEPIMMVSELDGAYFAVTHEVTDSAIAALELIGVNDTYYYKPGTNTADITWYIQRGRVSNYLSNSTGLYLAVNGKSIAMRAERFAWTVNDAGQFVTAENTGLCYDSKNRAFVVADKTGNDTNNWHLSLSASEQSLDALQQAEIYTRGGVTDDQYITICLPYAVSQTFLETAEVFNVSGKFVTGNRVTGISLTPEEGILEAGKPYVVHTLSSPLNAYYGEITTAKVVRALGLVGNLSEEPLAVPAGCYGLSNSRLRLVTEDGLATTGQYKAYFDLRDVPEVSSTNLPMGSKMMYTTDTTETPTDVNALFGNSSQINWQLPVYNVLGIQVGEDATGVLIQNGIKFLKY